MFCMKCGSQLVEGARFCNKCGTPVENAASANAASDAFQSQQTAFMEPEYGAQDLYQQPTTPMQQPTQPMQQPWGQQPSFQQQDQQSYQQENQQYRQQAYVVPATAQQAPAQKKPKMGLIIGIAAGVVAVAAVLVLHLHGEDGTAIGTQQGLYQFEYLQKVRPQPAQKPGIAAPQGDAVLEQPGGQSAQVPLGADVGAGPQDHIQPQFLGGFDVFHQIQPPGEVKFSLFALMEVPAAVGFQGIEAAGLQF